MKLVQDRLNEVEMDLTRLKVEGTGMTSFVNSTSFVIC